MAQFRGRIHAGPGFGVSRRIVTGVAIMIVGVLSAVLMACGGGEKSSASSSSGLAEAGPEIQALYKGTYKAPEQGPKPQPGKRIMILSCGESVSTCAEASAGAKEAATSIGWKTTIFDTKGDRNLAAAGIRQAIVSGVDGVFVYFTDCRLIKQALVEAQRADLPVVAAESLECDREPGAKKLFTSSVLYEDGDYAQRIEAYGALQAKYIVDRLQGKANVINFVENDVLGTVLQQKGEKKVFDACAGCTVHEVEVTFADVEAGLQAKAQQALVRYPNANAVLSQYDGMLLAGISAAVSTSGRDVLLMAAEGSQATMDLVREKKVTAGFGIPIEWEGYAGIEALNRVFHDAPPASSGIGEQAYDYEHNSEGSGPYTPPVDFRAAYRKIWGVDQ